MAELISVKFSGTKGEILGKYFDAAKAKHLLREAIDDIADAVENNVRQETVPIGETAQLKLHPIDREDTRVGVAEPRAFTFGGGIAARGPGGRFVAGNIPIEAGGDLIARSILTVARDPKYAIWVHQGTGIYKPGGSGKYITTNPPGRYMVFRWQGKNFRLKRVKGQSSNPYLAKAFLFVEKTYIPVRIELLRAQIAAAT